MQEKPVVFLLAAIIGLLCHLAFVLLTWPQQRERTINNDTISTTSTSVRLLSQVHAGSAVLTRVGKAAPVELPGRKIVVDCETILRGSFSAYQPH